MSDNGSSQTEGQVDGRPANLTYGPGDHEEETVFSWTEDSNNKSQRTAIPRKHILATVQVRKQPTTGDYHFLYVENNPAAEQDKTASPVVFRSRILTNPPIDLIKDLQHHAGYGPNLHVVISTGSGTGLAKAVWDELIQPALQCLKVEQEEQCQTHFTTSENSIVELTRVIFLPQAILGVAQSIILLSGDGGVLDIVNTLLSGNRGNDYKKPNLSIISTGTGNALAHSAGVTSDDSLGLRTWIRGQPRALPLFAATFSPGARVLFDEARQERPLHRFNDKPTAHGAVVCSWGLHAGLVADSDTAEYRKFGVERFKMAAKEALFPSDGSPHTYQGAVSILRPGQDEWEEIRLGEHAYVLVTLVSQLEKGFTISPESKPLDGKLRLVHFGPVSGEAAMDIMGKAYQGGLHIEDERVGYEEVTALRIEFNEEDGRWRRVCIDGQIIRVERGGWVEVRTVQRGVVDLNVQ